MKTNDKSAQASRHARGMGWLIAFSGLAVIGISSPGCGFEDVIDDLAHQHPGDHGGGGHAGGCVVDGVRHAVGESFASSDGCNSCSCNRGGQVACTLRACVAICGGLTGASCPDDQFCSFAPEAQCGAADQTGICVAKPDACTKEYDPVCGCDDQTYGNACTAAAAGVSVAASGECPGDGEPRVCGGLLGLGCDPGEFCNFPPEAICGAADATGTCEAKPEVCTFIFDPVCGCDGNTYPSACVAASEGVSVASQGECEPGTSGNAAAPE